MVKRCGSMTALRLVLFAALLASGYCYKEIVNITAPVKARVTRVIPLFGLDVGGTVVGEASFKSAGWPQGPSPAGVTAFLAFLTARQWCEPRASPEVI
jgi:hypothetical protein